jgi:hypothetical protein
LVTLVATDGSAQIVWADIKVIVGKNIVSNLAHGLHGNLFAEIDVPTGRLKTPQIIDVERGGNRDVLRHPETAAPLEGFPIPAWEEILAITQRAAKFFLPVRTIGWDVALSGRGPRILEGNIWYDPVVQGFQTDHWMEPFRTMAEPAR